MTFIKLLTGLVGLFKTLAGLFRDEKLMKAGEDRYAGRQQTQRMDLIRTAQAARRAMVHSDDDGVPGDRFNRDNNG